MIFSVLQKKTQKRVLYVFFCLGVLLQTNVIFSASSTSMNGDIANDAMKKVEEMGFQPQVTGGYSFARSGSLKGKRDDLAQTGGRLQRQYKHELATAIHKKNESERNKALQTIAGNYKIHLMPKKGKELDVFERILLQVKKDAEANTSNGLHKLLHVVKVKNEPSKETAADFGDDIKPKVVAYPATGKENAQKALNTLYELFKDQEGTGVTPRFNAKVNSLIFVAQGDGDAKRMHGEYFENDGIYYKPSMMASDGDNFYLKHPETGEAIKGDGNSLDVDVASDSSSSDDDLTYFSSSSSSDDDSFPDFSSSSSSDDDDDNLGDNFNDDDSKNNETGAAAKQFGLKRTRGNPVRRK